MMSKEKLIEEMWQDMVQIRLKENRPFEDVAMSQCRNLAKQ